MDERNQSTPVPTSCFKCKAILPSLTALEVHLRSCTTEWEPPQSVPWTFIPPPDSLGAPGPAAGAGRGRGGSRGQGSGRRRGSGKTVTPFGGGSHGGSENSFSQVVGDKGATGSRGNTQGRGGHQGRGRGASGDKAERSGQEGGRGRGNGGSTRAGKQNTEHPKSNSGRQREPFQGTRVRRPSTTDSNFSQPSSGSLKSSLPSQGNAISQPPDQAQATKSQTKGPTCSKCQLSFANSQGLVHHFNTSPAHPNSGFSPPSPSNTSALPALQPRSPTSGPSHCTKCDIMFDCPNDLAAHFRESGDHPFSLPILGYQYGVPVFDMEDSGGFDPRGDVTEEVQEETMRRRANHWFGNIEEEEAELICAMRRFDLGKYY